MVRPRRAEPKRKSRRIEHSRIKEDIQSSLSQKSLFARRSRSALRPAGYTTRPGEKQGRRWSYDWSIEIHTPPQYRNKPDDVLHSSSTVLPDDTNWTTSREFTLPVEDPISRLRRRRASRQECRRTTMDRMLRLVSPMESDQARQHACWYCKIPDCTFVQEAAHTLQGQEAITAHYNAHAEATSEALQLIGQMGDLKTNALLEKLQGEARTWSQAMESDLLLLNAD